MDTQFHGQTRDNAARTPAVDRAATGIAGLDDVLGGGLTRGRLYLVEGPPGAGKTQFLVQRGCTVLVLDDSSASEAELHVQTLAHGIIVLEQGQPEYGNERRRLRVVKFRGASYSGGYHDFVIRKGGIMVFRRLVAAEARRPVVLEKLPSGVAGIDHLMGGGIERGTSTLIAGAAGSGKSTLAAQFVLERSIREFWLSSSGIDVGEPLRQFRGVLTGVPVFEDSPAPLMAGRS